MKPELSFGSTQELLGTIAYTVFLFEDDKNVPKELQEVDAFLEGRLAQLVSSDDFIPSAYQRELLYANPEIEQPRVVVFGLGKQDSATLQATWEHACASAAMYWQSRKIKEFALIVPAHIKKKLKAQAGLFLAKGIQLGAYDFNNYKSDKKQHAPKLEEVVVCNIESKEETAWDSALFEGEEIGASVNVTRTLGDIPPSDMTPARLAKEALALGKEFPKLSVSVLEESDIKKLKMGALLGVNMGSHEPPKFIIMQWLHAKSKQTAPVVLVGKGITFDSGGISIKPSEKMDEMKMDMMGGAAVVGAMRAIAAMNLKVNVVGLVPATENMPGGKAYRPGDILTGMGGKTIEVLNTDAEGRLILSDALEYAKQYKPQLVVDAATLTGACVRAVGEEYAGLFTRDHKIKKAIETAAEESNEPVWQLPLDDSHVLSVKSQVADVKNIGSAPPGASTAAAFLEFFTDYPWAHLDIAGPMAYTKPQPFQRQGARGYGVHLFVRLVQNWFNA